MMCSPIQISVHDMTNMDMPAWMVLVQDLVDLVADSLWRISSHSLEIFSAEVSALVAAAELVSAQTAAQIFVFA